MFLQKIYGHFEKPFNHITNYDSRQGRKHIIFIVGRQTVNDKRGGGDQKDIESKVKVSKASYFT